MIWILVVLFIVYLAYAANYRKTVYFKITHKSYLSVLFDKGAYGEYLTYCNLKKYEKDGAKFLFNCYLPKSDGETTEIDVLMIHKSGIYVFESKNYSGWIFGSENQKTWTQSLPNGRRSRKEHFLNPIMQNKLHIRWLREEIGEAYPISSVIVFSERCTLKQVNVTSSDIYVINRNNIARTVSNIEKGVSSSISEENIESIFDTLYPFTQATYEQKEEHVKNIKANIEKKANDDICPRCGGKLVLRQATKGKNAGNEFYGCSNYPKCRYIKNVN